MERTTLARMTVGETIFVASPWPKRIKSKQNINGAASRQRVKQPWFQITLVETNSGFDVTRTR